MPVHTFVAWVQCTERFLMPNVPGPCPRAEYKLKLELIARSRKTAIVRQLNGNLSSTVKRRTNRN